MKAKRHEIQFIDGPLLAGVLLRPADRKFVGDTFLEVLTAAQDFLVDYTAEERLEREQIDLEDLFIDHERGEIVVTASIQLRCKFQVDGKQLQVTEVDFRD